MKRYIIAFTMVMAAIQTISAQSQNFKLGQWSEIKNSIIKELNLS